MKFSDYRQDIIEALSKLYDSNPFSDENDFILINGFLNYPIQPELDGSINMFGTTMPMIGVIGANTGRIYFFALKILLPYIKF